MWGGTKTDDYAFSWACANCHESIAYWLYGLGGVNIHAGNDYAFRMNLSRTGCMDCVVW